MNPIKDIAAIERPKLGTSLSTLFKLASSECRDAIKIHPVKKSRNGSPGIIQTVVEVEKVMTATSRMVNIPMIQRPLSLLAFIVKLSYLTLTGIVKSISHFASSDYMKTTVASRLVVYPDTQ